MNNYESVVDDHYEYIRLTMIVIWKVLTLDMKRHRGSYLG